MPIPIARFALPVVVVILGGLVALGLRPERSSTVSGDAPRSAPIDAMRADDAVPLDLDEVFVRPVGPRGLELTERVRELAGRRVRVLGYVVRQERPTAGRLLLAARPMQLHEEEYGFADDLPAATLLVLAPGATARTFVEGRPPRGPLIVAGTLEVGNRVEPDGRVSTLRLTLDRTADAVRAAPAVTRSMQQGERS